MILLSNNADVVSGGALDSVAREAGFRTAMSRLRPKLGKAASDAGSAAEAIRVLTSDHPERRRRCSADQLGASDQCIQSLNDLQSQRREIQMPRDLLAVV